MEIKPSLLKFPPNMADWIKRHVGNYNPYNEALGTKIGTNQSKQFYDFNKDGKKDICIELGLEYFRPQAQYDSAYAYYKGIFINKGNDVFELDTNYIINGRGRPWSGKFGDFNGDGLVDYAHVNENYHGDQAKKPLDLFTSKDVPDGSPSHVFFNNGKSFDRVNLDTINMISENCEVYDINGDGRDEIISMPQEKFIVYTYNLKTKQFDRSHDNINQLLKQKYSSQLIKFFTFGKIENAKLRMAVSHDSFTPDLTKAKIDIAEINLKDSSITIINSFQHPQYKLSDGTISLGSIQANESYKYEDLNGDGINELIMISPFGNKSELMGFNIIENNQLATTKYWTPDLNENGFRIQGYIKDLTGDGKSDIVSSEWNLDKSQNYFNYYYYYTNGKYVNTKMTITPNSVKPLNIPYWTWVEDFNEDGINDVFIFNVNNVIESYFYKSVNCSKATKPILNTTKLSFCTNETLKLNITNTTSGDAYKWYFGKQIDSSNVSTKTYSDSGKLVISKTDVNGCTSQTDTLTITKFAAIPTPSITRNGNNLNSSSTSGNQWFLDGVKLANETNSSIKASNNGIYTVQVTGSNGCSSDVSKGEYGLITAMEAAEPESIGVSPNPFINLIRLDIPKSFGEKAQISLTDISGKFYIQKLAIIRQQELNLSFLPAGNYFLRIESLDQTQNKTIKITKQE
jgi:Secretion system C-terminal sorting domain/FG-GAP-like repeat